MTKKKVIWSGAISVLPMLSIFILIVVMVVTAINAIDIKSPRYLSDQEVLAPESTENDYFQEEMPSSAEAAREIVMEIVNTLHYCMIPLVIIFASVSGYFVYDLFTNPYIKEKRFTMWAVLLVFLGFFVYPVYWFVNIFKARRRELKMNRSQELPAL